MAKQRIYSNFSEYLYWSYANLQMLHYAFNSSKADAPLWNKYWQKAELAIKTPYDSIVNGETLKKVTPLITFRKTRRYTEFSSNSVLVAYSRFND